MADRYAALVATTKAEFPRFRVRRLKGSWLWPFFLLVKWLTRQESTGYTITVFSTVHVGDDWDAQDGHQRYKTLRHERCHLRQFHSWPLGRWAWPLNHLLTLLAYGLLLPVFFTLRARFEREGYLQDLLVDFETQERRFTDLEMESNARWLVEVFSGPGYLWMWRRRKTYLWAMNAQRLINAKIITADSARAVARLALP